MIGVIADDLTGAAEIGAVGLRHGLRAEIVTRDKPFGDMDLICVDTDSRASSREEAARRVTAAADALHKAGAEWIYKKVDSVLRGYVTAEVEAAMKHLQFNRALLVPANPSLGRVIRDERYFVKGKPIHKTEFAHDPEHPRQSADVLELLGRSQAFSVFVRNGDEALPETGIVVGQAATPRDVLRWAESRDAQTTFAAGGAEFFGALLKVAGHEITPSLVEQGAFQSAERELFVCGTTSESARAFVRGARLKKTPVFSLPVELVWGADFSSAAVEAIGRRVLAAYQTSPRVILNVGLTMARERSASRRMVENLARLARWVLREMEVGRIYAEGGATAAELVRRMSWPKLTVLQELSPGVVVLAVSADESRFLIIKPGSYVWPATILHRDASEDVSVDVVN